MRKSLCPLFVVGSFLLALGITHAQQRALLFAHEPSEPLRKVIGLLSDLATPPIDAKQLACPRHYFVRIAPRASILSETNGLLDSAVPNENDAILGTRPFVFLTSPESLYGRSLLEMYQDIGYEAEDILRYQLNQDMVAIVFRYPDNVTPAPEVSHGQLPLDWSSHVYVPHWDNMFALFHRLAQDATVEPGKTGQFAPFRLFFGSVQEKAFALKASKRPNSRLKRLPYVALKVRGGNDWHYRQLLEYKLSIFAAVDARKTKSLTLLASRWESWNSLVPTASSRSCPRWPLLIWGAFLLLILFKALSLLQLYSSSFI